MATDVKTVDKKTEADVKTDDKETEEPAPVASILELDRSPEATEAGAKLALVNVGARRKRATVTVNDRYVGLFICVETIQRLAEGINQLVAEGVQLPRSVEGNDRDLILHPVMDEVVKVFFTHWAFPSSLPNLARGYGGSRHRRRR